MKSNKKTHTGLFIAVFLVIVGLTIVNNLIREDHTTLTVPNNHGVSGLKSVDGLLACTFSDGRIVTWAWASYKQAGDFKAVSDRVIVLDSQHAAAVNTSGKKILTVYSLPSGQKEKDLTVGWEDQDVWLRISPDKNTLVLIRQNSRDANGSSLFEFSMIDLQKEFLSPPVLLTISGNTDDLVDYAVDSSGVLVAVGSQAGTGRIAAIDLAKGAIMWDRAFEDTREFCSVMTASDSNAVYAGNRDGILYKLDIKTGDITKKIQLLEKGETRPITNDYSVLNLAFSPNGQYFVATINPKAYILKSESDEIFHIATPADRLVSKIAFSPDNRYFATSDIRAGYPVKIWPLPKEK